MSLANTCLVYCVITLTISPDFLYYTCLRYSQTKSATMHYWPSNLKDLKQINPPDIYPFSPISGSNSHLSMSKCCIKTVTLEISMGKIFPDTITMQYWPSNFRDLDHLPFTLSSILMYLHSYQVWLSYV